MMEGGLDVSIGGMLDGTSNGSSSDYDDDLWGPGLNCSNEYCVSEEDYMDMIEEHIRPRPYEWALIVLFGLVFVVGLVGNCLVCTAVYRNHVMRTVTNYFIVNLAVADFMVILICLPPTVVWDVTETWFLGDVLCKVVLYFQTVSVSVSVLTLTFISIDRWYAICFPLKFKSTTSRAKTAIVVIWIVSLVLDIPELVVLQTRPRQYMAIETQYFTQCTATWSDESEMVYSVMKAVLLYTLPLAFMSVAYYQIVRVLWRADIPGRREAAPHNANNSHHNMNYSCRGKSSVGSTTGVPLVPTASCGGQHDGPLRARRKAAKMLVVVVVMFAVCYFPVHLLNILRYIFTIPQNDLTSSFSMISHWLCYANSAMNPVIYNFMSGKFRKEFSRAFCWGRGRKRRRGQHGPVSGSTYVWRFTRTMSVSTPRTEELPMTSIVTTIPDLD